MKITDLIPTSGKWNDPDPAVRLEAIRTQAPDDTVLAQLIEDPDEDVRCAAAGLLSSIQQTRALIATASGKLAAAAQERYIKLLNASEDLAAGLSELATIDDHGLLKQIALVSEVPELAAAALSRLNDEKLLIELSLDAYLAQVRQAAAQKIEAVDSISLLARKSQGHDKSVYRIAKDKLSALHQVDDSRRQLLDDCESLVDSIVEHAKAILEPTYERKWKSLVSSWQELEASFHLLSDADEVSRLGQFRSRFDAASSDCEERLKGPAGEEEVKITSADAEALMETVAATLAELGSTRVPLDDVKERRAEFAREWRKIPKEATAPGLREEYFKALDKIDHVIEAETRWQSQSGKVESLIVEAQAQQHEKDLKPATRKELKRLLARMDWAEAMPAPEELAQAQGELERLDNLHQQMITREGELQDQLVQKLDLLDEAIAAGALKRAEKLFKDAQQFKTNIRSRSFQQDRLTSISVQIRELRDWQGFATNPKREELCVKMEGLVSDEMNPRDKAERIKSLQEEWKNLGSSHSYKSQKMWHRFKTAGDKAYEPCKQYFQDQEAIRAQNLKERETICAALENFLEKNDWEHVNWKAVADIIHTAKNEWRRFDNINRSKRKGIQSRFYGVIDQLQAKLADEQHRNRDKKQELIEQVKASTDESVELQGAINRTKDLQQQWKKIGITERRTDQALWTEFRKYCDLVFDRRNQQNEAHQQKEEENRLQAETICMELEQNAARAMDDENAGVVTPGELKQARRKFNEINVPQHARRSLQTRFDAASRSYDQALDHQKTREQQLLVSELHRKAALCRLLESGTPSQDLASLQESWVGEASCKLPAEVSEKMEPRWLYALQIVEGTADDLPTRLDNNLREAQLLCIQLELLAAIEPPPEAQSLLMEYQVSRLKKVLSDGERETRSPAEQRKSLEFQWFCLGPLPADAIESLETRFTSAITAIESASSGSPQSQAKGAARQKAAS